MLKILPIMLLNNAQDYAKELTVLLKTFTFPDFCIKVSDCSIRVY